MKNKPFDCVEMMHKGGQKILEEIEGMTPDQEMEYWQQQTQALRELQRQMRERQETEANLPEK